MKKFHISIISWFIMNKKWSKILLDQDMIDEIVQYIFKATKSLIDTSNMFYVIQTAMLHYPEATLVCIMSPSELLFAASRVSPLYINQTSDTKLCFTSLRRDLVPNATATGMDIFAKPWFEMRNAANLVTFPFMGKYDRCVDYTIQVQITGSCLI